MKLFASSSDVPVGANILSCKLFKHPNAFMNGIAEINMPDGSGGTTPGTYLVQFQETLQVDIRSSAIENPLLKAGTIGNLLFNVKNTGNVPVSKFSMDAYALDMQGNRRNLSKINVVCVDPVTSSASSVSAEGLIRSMGKSSAAVSECDYALDEDYRMMVTSVDGSTSAYATNALMPGETRCYRATFRVPENFDPGQYDAYVKPVSISTIATRDPDGKLDSTSAWISTMLDIDSAEGQAAMRPAGVNKRPALRANRNLITVTAEVVEDQPTLLHAGAARQPQDSKVKLTIEGISLASGEGSGTMLSAYADRTTANTSDLDLS